MKFLFHFYDLHQRAGIQRAICELLNELVAEGHAAVLVSNTHRTDFAYPIDERVEIEAFSNPEPRLTGIRAWLRKSVWALQQAFILRQLVRRHRPDLVADHGTALGLLYPFRRLGGAPFVLQRHFPVLAFPHGKFLYKLLSFLAGAKITVVLTESIEAEFRTHGYREVMVIPNPVPQEAKTCPFPDTSPRLGLLMGRAGNPQKGFDIFLKALALRRIEGWRFRIVGPGADTDPQLRELVRVHQLADQVELMPSTPDPYQMLREAACVIMPSRYEALPMVALEALSIGRPVLGAEVDGLSELIVPNVNGFLFPAGDEEALSKALIESCGDPGRLKRLALNAPGTLHRYSRSTIVGEWLALARRLNLDRIPKG